MKEVVLVNEYKERITIIINEIIESCIYVIRDLSLNLDIHKEQIKGNVDEQVKELIIEYEKLGYRICGEDMCSICSNKNKDCTNCIYNKLNIDKQTNELMCNFKLKEADKWK